MLNHEKSMSRHHCQLLDYLKNRCNEEAIDMLKNVEISKLIDSSGQSLLHWSVKFGNVEMMQYFIEKQSNIDCQDNDGNTPLMFAVEAGEEYIMEALIKAGVDVYIVNKKGECPIKVVLTSWILPGKRVVKVFLDRLRDDCDNDKQTLVNKLMDFECPIYFAVLLRDAEITRMMLDRGCCIEARCHKVYDTALHEAVAQSDLANVKLLVDRGLFIMHYINYKGQTPLCRYNVWTKDSEEKLQILKFLITKGARLYTEKSPLERLFKDGSEETVCTLLQIEGMNLRSEYNKNRTALHLICMNENPGMAEALRLFRGKDFDIHAMDEYDNTALMIAASIRCVKKVQCLLEMGASVRGVHRIPNVLYAASNSENEWASEPPGNYKKIIDLLLQHETGTRFHREVTFLEEVTMKRDFYVAQSHLAWLAQMKILCGYRIDYYTLQEITRVEKHEVYFAWCVKHLEEMKTYVVHGSITLLQLLVESQRQLNLYARNDEFVSRYSSTAIESLESIPHYYSNTIQRRVAAAIKRANLERKAVGIVCKIVGLFIDKRSIVFEVFNYLSEQDIQNLIDSI